MRTGYINLLLEAGHDVKTVQELARHATVNLTLNTYGRARPARMVAAVEGLGRTLKDCRANRISIEPEKSPDFIKIQPLEIQGVASKNDWSG